MQEFGEGRATMQAVRLHVCLSEQNKVCDDTGLSMSHDTSRLWKAIRSISTFSLFIIFSLHAFSDFRFYIFGRKFAVVYVYSMYGGKEQVGCHLMVQDGVCEPCFSLVHWLRKISICLCLLSWRNMLVWVDESDPSRQMQSCKVITIKFRHMDAYIPRHSFPYIHIVHTYSMYASTYTQSPFGPFAHKHIRPIGNFTTHLQHSPIKHMSIEVPSE